MSAYSPLTGQPAAQIVASQSTPRGTVRVPLPAPCPYSPRRDQPTSGGAWAPTQVSGTVYTSPPAAPPQVLPVMQQCASEPLRANMTYDDVVAELQALKVKQSREFSYLMQEQKRREQIESYLRVEVERLRADYKNILEQLSNECSMRDRERMQFQQEIELLRMHIGTSSDVPIGALGSRRGSRQNSSPVELSPPLQTSPPLMVETSALSADDRAVSLERSLEMLKAQFEGVNQQQQRRTEELAQRLERLIGGGGHLNGHAVNLLGPNSGTRSDSPSGFRNNRGSTTPDTPRSSPPGRQDSKPPSEAGRPRTSTKDLQLRDRTASDRSARGGSKVPVEVEHRLKEVEANGNIAVNLSTGQVQLLQEFEFLPGNMDTPQAGFLAGVEAVKPILDDLAELALASSEPFLVEAHCRKKGTEFWQTLADNRARLVANELLARGVPEEKLQVRGTPGKHGKANRHMTLAFVHR
mmetsp:Transcript_72592/g.135596  ORF Transcript_72592/g.135596 Transcript_72592/m.135596 type:complete len:468 (+) Transcript_72592:88-1491(+)